MIERIFTSLTQAVEGSAAIAIAASFVWGILSILLSPCHLASIPLIVGFVDRAGPDQHKKGVCDFSGVCGWYFDYHIHYRACYCDGRQNYG